LKTSCDVLVAGGGPAGLVAACLFARSGRKVVLAAGARPAGDDPRTVALMQPSIRLLAHLGIWPGTLQEKVSPLRRLRLVDDTGGAHRSPTLTFDAAEIGEDVFGWNLPLRLLVPDLQHLAEGAGVQTLAADVTDVRTVPDAVEVTAGEHIFSASLAIAADGRKSLLREAAGISCNAWAYDQVAIATSFAHSAPHDGMSTEYHRAAGPFTTVPLLGRASSLVWMERPARAGELMGLDDQALAVEIQLASHGDLGRVSDIGSRKAFAMEGLIARSFAARRIMLIGEAAHVVPPIGAQGLNMSLRDAAQAADLVGDAGDPGAADILADYDRLRRRDVVPRQQIIDLMNRSLLSGYLAMDTGRALALETLAAFGPLRRFVMRRGLGPVSGLPPSMMPPVEAESPSP
jgi:2-octaprenyl-6-methoxyphenol hydroxylase